MARWQSQGPDRKWSKPRWSWRLCLPYLCFYETLFPRVNATHFVLVLQEMILQKVKEDMMVRTKISQSSALRQKRHQTGMSQKPDVLKTDSPLGLNNNGPVCYTDRNKFVHTNGTVGDTEMKNLKVTDDQEEDEEEEESFVSESLSEVSKFESLFSLFCESLLMFLGVQSWCHLYVAVPSPDLSFQPDERLEVYVSASENPNHFWIQILGVRSLQLDKLTAEMNSFYSSGNSTVRTCSVLIMVAPWSQRLHGSYC